jgi:excisionase family DNA binding protein
VTDVQLFGDETVSDLDLEEETRLLRPREVAALFQVSPKTVTRWARAGKLECVRTLGGHRRFPVDAVRKALESAEPTYWAEA